MSRQLRTEALRLLDGRGAILNVAREVSEVLDRERIDGAVIGGVAVVLHGHVRTTVDVDVFTRDLSGLAGPLIARGFTFDEAGKQFVKDDIPVHMVTLDVVAFAPASREVREGIVTVSLADLVTMKLRSGTTDPLRAQDLADVIGLIRANALDAGFASRLPADLRAEFRALARAVRRGEP